MFEEKNPSLQASEKQTLEKSPNQITFAVRNFKELMSKKLRETLGERGNFLELGQPHHTLFCKCKSNLKVQRNELSLNNSVWKFVHETLNSGLVVLQERRDTS